MLRLAALAFSAVLLAGCLPFSGGQFGAAGLALVQNDIGRVTAFRNNEADLCNTVLTEAKVLIQTEMRKASTIEEFQALRAFIQETITLADTCRPKLIIQRGMEQMQE